MRSSPARSSLAGDAPDRDEATPAPEPASGGPDAANRDPEARRAPGAASLDPEARRVPGAASHELEARRAPGAASLDPEERRVPGVASLDPEARRAPEAASIGPEDRLQRALDAAYRYLGKRDRTEAEVRRHLAARDIDDASIDGAVEALIRQRCVDDARYARTFAEDRRELDDWGPERIERRLLALGIDPDLVAGALADRDGAAELEAAVALLRRRFREIPATDRERERALGLLARKGYDLELAYDAVRAFAQL